MLRVLALSAFAAGSAETEENRPVTKVINLLKDMQKQLEKEGEDDQEVYDKMQCWCTTNDKAKTQAIKDAENLIDQLTSTVEELAAQSARLNAEIKNLEKEVGENTEALNQATELRQKQLAEFNAEEKDALQAVAALKAAITVLSKQHGSLVQNASDDRTAMINIAAVLRHHKYKYSDMMDTVMTPEQKQELSAFLEAPFKSYAPQSGAIFGILKNMKENFETNLSSSQKEETENQKAYENLKEAKEEEISAGQEQINVKSTQLGETDEKLVNAKQQIKDTKSSLSADEAFLLDLKEKCQLTDQEWGERQKTRQDEIAAVSQALNVLSGDDAHDTFTRTYNFMQITGEREQAAALVSKVGQKYGSKGMSALASKIKLDAFTKVKKAIDDMIAHLLQEKADEVKLRDWCTESLNENERQTKIKKRDHKDVSSRILDLESAIDTLKKTIETLNAEVVNLNTQLKNATEDRQAENKVFQTEAADQKATLALLKKAYDHLADFYAKKSFLQNNKGPASPAGFNTYGKNAGGNTVLQLLTTIVNDTKALEAELLRAEQDAQKAYEGFVTETNRSIETKTKARVDAEEDKAKKEVDLSDSKDDREGLQFTLDGLSTENTDVHNQCDFVLKNIDVRQDARDEEVQALRQAKDILSGSNFAGFLQK